MTDIELAIDRLSDAINVLDRLIDVNDDEELRAARLRAKEALMWLKEL